MDNLVLNPADQVLGVVPGQGRRYRVDEGRCALSVQPVDSLTRRVQDELVPAVEPPERILHLLALGDVPNIGYHSRYVRVVEPVATDGLHVPPGAVRSPDPVLYNRQLAPGFCRVWANDSDTCSTSSGWT